MLLPYLWINTHRNRRNAVDDDLTLLSHSAGSGACLCGCRRVRQGLPDTPRTRLRHTMPGYHRPLAIHATQQRRHRREDWKTVGRRLTTKRKIVTELLSPTGLGNLLGWAIPLVGIRQGAEVDCARAHASQGCCRQRYEIIGPWKRRAEGCLEDRSHTAQSNRVVAKLGDAHAGLGRGDGQTPG